PGVLAAEAERTPVGQRKEVGIRALDDAQPVLDQAQVADHPRVQQADGVAGQRVAEARVELLGHGGAADHPAPLQHPDLQPGRGQVGGADQAVVAAADDQDVVVRLMHARIVRAARARPPGGWPVGLPARVRAEMTTTGRRWTGIALIALLALLAVARSAVGTRLDSFTVDEP